ncbi:MAG: TRM11 family methyltransferase [Methanolobus sp.]
MLYAFELSGEHALLPQKEVFACLSMEDLEYSEHASYENCLVLDIEGEAIDKKLEFIAERLAMSHHILKVVGISEIETDSIIKMCDDADISEHLPAGQTYVVRAKRVKHHGDIKREFIEGRLGGSIFRKGFRANMKNPDVTFRLIMTDMAVLGSIVASVDRGAYEHRAPHRKPFFYPGVLMPRVARALVNISQVKGDEILFDPFSGTAGILVEAGLVGAHVIGIEVRHKISHGARMNLDEYNADYSLMVGDACRVPLKNSCVDAIVTDPPYGRSAAIRAESLNHLYTDSFAEMYRVLKSGKLAVVVSELKVVEFAEKAGFTVVDVFTQKVHKSLTRTFTVLYKD